MSKSNLPARKVTIVLAAREDDDPASLLAAVRGALVQHGVDITLPEGKATIGAEAQTEKDHVLQDKAMELAMRILDREAAKADQERLKSDVKRERAIAEIVAQRSGIKAYLQFWGGQCARISVELLETFATASGRVAKKIVSIFQTSDEED
jgi:hypothetical protein